uniref:Uncharacterized protein n=1 Tax=Oryza nivara TaxID=4536 RepID=A0A0E0H9I7_ORYNI
MAMNDVVVTLKKIRKDYMQTTSKGPQDNMVFREHIFMLSCKKDLTAHVVSSRPEMCLQFPPTFNAWDILGCANQICPHLRCRRRRNPVPHGGARSRWWRPRDEVDVVECRRASASAAAADDARGLKN